MTSAAYSVCIKKALIRDASVPVGGTAGLHVTCLCRAHVDIADSSNVCLSCGREWDGRGYLTFDPTPAG